MCGSAHPPAILVKRAPNRSEIGLEAWGMYIGTFLPWLREGAPSS